MRKNGPSPYYFDKAAADRAARFFPRFLRHFQGEWAGRPFELQRWQERDVIRPLFGIKRRADGLRRYRTAYIEIPKKNGKSTLAAGIALCCLYCDREPGAEVYSAAGDRDQARIVFEAAKRMVEASPALLRRARIYRNAIVLPKSGSSYKVLSAEAPTKHGPNVHCVVFDELHVQPNRELWDAVTKGVAARRQPLVVAITTAGIYDKNSICWEQHDYAEKVLKGVIPDPAFFDYIRGAASDEDWTKRRTWRKANPSFGVTIKPEFLAAECREAIQKPAYQNTFRRFFLNQWTAQRERWLDMGQWAACGEAVDPAALEGRPCYAGLDLATTTDIAALALVFPPQEEGEPYQLLLFFWVPEEGMLERARKDRVPYDLWARQGYIRATEGNVIDYRAIKGLLVDDLAKCFDVREVAFDRWGSQAVVNELVDAGLTMIQFGQGFASMSPPTKELLNLVVGKKIRHGSNPVLDWMADNMVVRTDPAGNVKPDRAKSTEKIDGMVASIMALDRAIRNQAREEESVYARQGILFL